MKIRKTQIKSIKYFRARHFFANFFVSLCLSHYEKFANFIRTFSVSQWRFVFHFCHDGYIFSVIGKMNRNRSIDVWRFFVCVDLMTRATFSRSKHFIFVTQICEEFFSIDNVIMFTKACFEKNVNGIRCQLFLFIIPLYFYFLSGKPSAFQTEKENISIYQFLDSLLIFFLCALITEVFWMLYMLPFFSAFKYFRGLNSIHLHFYKEWKWSSGEMLPLILFMLNSEMYA